ncbi:hypothetical protein [Pseudonocardia xinjiangensis]|nr:hypothetical protein [Pseudonocardia xinjiangensis]
MQTLGYLAGNNVSTSTSLFALLVGCPTGRPRSRWSASSPR